MSLFSFKLSDWQEKAVSSIKDGGHCLVTAPTGSGKTVPAEFAIDHFNSNGKRLFIHLLSRHFLIKNIMSFKKNFLM